MATPAGRARAGAAMLPVAAALLLAYAPGAAAGLGLRVERAALPPRPALLCTAAMNPFEFKARLPYPEEAAAAAEGGAEEEDSEEGGGDGAFVGRGQAVGGGEEGEAAKARRRIKLASGRVKQVFDHAGIKVKSMAEKTYSKVDDLLHNAQAKHIPERIRLTLRRQRDKLTEKLTLKLPGLLLRRLGPGGFLDEGKGEGIPEKDFQMCRNLISEIQQFSELQASRRRQLLATGAADSAQGPAPPGEPPGPGEWEMLSDKPHAQIWRKEAPHCAKKSFVYRARAHFDDSIELVFDAISDVANRMEWDSTCLEMRRIKMMGATDVIYWRVKFPFPLKDRDYVYYRRLHTEEDGRRFMISKGAKLGKHVGLVDGVVRIENFLTKLALERNKVTGGVDYYIEYFEEPKGNIPQWAVNFAMDKAVDMMVEGMRRQIAQEKERARHAGARN